MANLPGKCAKCGRELKCAAMINPILQVWVCSGCGKNPSECTCKRKE